MKYSWNPAGSVSVLSSMSSFISNWNISPSNPSGYSVLKTSVFSFTSKCNVLDCSLIIALTICFSLISDLNSEKETCSGALMFSLYCCTPRKINKPKAAYKKNGLFLFFLYFPLLTNLILTRLKVIAKSKKVHLSMEALYIYRCNLGHTQQQILDR